VFAAVEYSQLHRDFVEFLKVFPQWSPTLLIPLSEFVSYSLNIEMKLAKLRKWRFDLLRLFHPTIVSRQLPTHTLAMPRQHGTIK
jgi:hypothetical protein